MTLALVIGIVLAQAAPDSSAAPAVEAPASPEYRSLRVTVEGSDPRGWPAVKKGDAPVVLSGADVYTAIARRDLASRYRFRSLARPAGIALGGAILLVGGSAAVLHWRDRDCGRADAFDWGACSDTIASRQRQAALIGLGTVGLAALTGWFAYTLEPHPVGPDELRGLIQEYDGKLRGRVGLSRAPARRSGDRERIGLDLRIGGDRASVVIAGAF